MHTYHENLQSVTGGEYFTQGYCTILWNAIFSTKINTTKEYVRKCVPHVSTPMYICKTHALQTHWVCTYTYIRTYMHTHDMVQSSNPISITAEQFVCIWCVGGPWGLTRYQAPLVCCWSWVHRIKPERPHYSAHWRQGLACAAFGLTTR